MGFLDSSMVVSLTDLSKEAALGPIRRCMLWYHHPWGWDAYQGNKLMQQELSSLYRCYGGFLVLFQLPKVPRLEESGSPLPSPSKGWFPIHRPPLSRDPLCRGVWTVGNVILPSVAACLLCLLLQEEICPHFVPSVAPSSVRVDSEHLPWVCSFPG